MSGLSNDGDCCTILWRGPPRRQVSVLLPQHSLLELHNALRASFAPDLDQQDFRLYLNDRELVSDAQLSSVRRGDVLTLGAGPGAAGMPTPSSMAQGRPPLSNPSPGSAMRNGGVLSGAAGMSGAARGAGNAGAPGSGVTPSAGREGYKPPAKERVSFCPHPKTLTMAGDYEYFSAQGHHPFAFALAELVDNSLRATKQTAQLAPQQQGPPALTQAPQQRQQAAPAASQPLRTQRAPEGGAGASSTAVGVQPRQRSITISLLVNPKGTAGLIRVQDNGRGMSPPELNQWAVMNLSMEDRGLMRSEEQLAAEAAGGGCRYLSGDLSFFGVGSKNAAFFMGASVRVATRQAGSEHVHELLIEGAELERRYARGEAVYEEDMLHRMPGDNSTLTAQERAYPPSHEWVASELDPAYSSFTRVTISDLKSDILAKIRDKEAAACVCRDLAHLYHYYLHGPQGNTTTGSGRARSGLLPNGEPAPCIVVEYLVGDRLLWSKDLVQVDDDLESRYIRAAKAKMEFALNVPSRGVVEGVLWYFPFDAGVETVPAHEGAGGYVTGAGLGVGALSQAAGQYELTQLSLHGAAKMVATQYAQAAARVQAGGTQAMPEQMRRALQDHLEEEEAEGARSGTAPMFEVFWQGRLIPGSVVDGLPFIGALRSKLGSASGKDYLPDEVFGRVRGALFFGPAWRVTRNKLTFRDPLPQLLAGASATDRGIEKRLREWLRECHTSLDRILRFEGPADAALKAVVRKELGDGVTVFMQVKDGARTIRAGDVVRLATKPATLGLVKYLAVPQVVSGEGGTFAHGFVTYAALPSFMHGDGHTTLPLRRVEEVVGQRELDEHTARERAKMPSSLSVSPLLLAPGRRVELRAGDTIADTAVAVLNANGQRMTKMTCMGQKVSLRVQQRLVYMGPARPSAYCGPGAGGDTSSSEGAAPMDVDANAGAPGPSAAAAAAAAAQAAAAAAEAAAAAAAAAAGGRRGRKRGARGKGAAATAADGAASPGDAGKENAPPAEADPNAATKASGTVAGAGAGAPGPLPAGVGEQIICIENKTPTQDSFQFLPITGGLTKAGTYFLEFRLLPETRDLLPAGAGAAAAAAVLPPVYSYTVIYAAAGAPTRFELRGEGRAAAASKALMLGEPLPPLQLRLYDVSGNTVPYAGEAGTCSVTVEPPAPTPSGNLAGGAASQGAVEELQVAWRQGSADGSLVLEGLALMGPAGAAPQGGMRLFQPPAGPSSVASSEVALGAQRQAGGPGSTPQPVEVTLRVACMDLPPQLITVRVRPGAPALMRLQPGHPFGGASGEPPQHQHAAGTQHGEGDAAAADEAAGSGVLAGPRRRSRAGSGSRLNGSCVVMNGEAMPEFQVLVLDAWGNPTSPSQDLACRLVADSPVLQPSPATFDVGPRGIAVLDGLRASATDASCIGTPQVIALSLQTEAASGTARAALEAAAAAALAPAARCSTGAPGQGPTLELPLLVQPCTLPAALQLTWQGELLPLEPSLSGEGRVCVLREVAAGCVLSDLAVAFVDEAGTPAEPGFKGKLQVSWQKGSKRVTVDAAGAVVALPPLQVQTQASPEPQVMWVKFLGEGRALSGVVLEATLELAVVPGPPQSWSLSVVVYNAAGSGGGGEPTEALGHVAAGSTLCLEIDAQDANGNRCCNFLSGPSRPTPRVAPQAEEGATLVWDDKEWIQGWQMTQAGSYVYQVQLALGGSAGPIKLVVRDDAGPGGESLLQPDTLPLELMPGAAAALSFDGPQQLQCGTRASLGELQVRVSDLWGNLVADGLDKLEVALASSALAVDGSGHAARVVVAGSNKAKVKRGVAVFKDVALQAEHAALYALRAASATRKYALTDANLSVQVTAQNVVRGLELVCCSLPEEPLDAGEALEVQVRVETEDGEPLPWSAAQGGLALRLITPNAAAAEALLQQQGAAGGGKTARNGGNAAVLLRPQPPDEEGASLGSRGVWTFVTPGPLTAAGQYSVTAEFTELRQELARSLAKKEQYCRSTSASLEVLPGPPTTAALDPDRPAGQLAVTNGSDARSQLLLPSAAVQLLDTFGNACALDGVPVRWALAWPDESVREQAEAAGAALPQLLASALPGGAEGGAEGGGACEWVEAATDTRGRAFFGQLSVAPGSGCVGQYGAEEGRQALHLELRMDACLPGGGEADMGEWTACWAAPVVFSDDAARGEALQRLCTERERLQAELERIAEERAALQRAADAARRSQRQADKELEQFRRQAGSSLPSGLASSAEAREALDRLHAQLQAKSQRSDVPPTAARFGHPKSGMLAALQRCLSCGDQDVVGVVAQLATVDDPHLSALISAAYGATLQILVVRTYECISRLRAMLSAGRFQVPSMLAYTMVQPFVRASEGAAADVQLAHVSEDARTLQAAACDGSDPPLPLALPHTRALLHQAPPPGGLAANQWPPGCVGFAVNLVRPLVAGHRASVLYSQLGRTLVFETLDQAAAYRQYVTQVLRSSLADVYTLDGGKLSGRGVVAGSGFRVVPLEEAQCRFGAAQHGQSAVTQQLQQQVSALEAVAEVMEAAEAAEQAVAEAETAAAEAEDRLQPQLDAHQAELERLDAEVRRLAGDEPGGRPAGGRRGRGGKRAREAAAEAAAEEAAPADGAPANDDAGDAGGQRAKRSRRLGGMQQ